MPVFSGTKTREHKQNRKQQITFLIEYEYKKISRKHSQVKFENILRGLYVKTKWIFKSQIQDCFNEYKAINIIHHYK